MWEAEPRGGAIEALTDPAPPESLLMASTLALMPLAYAAKWWSDRTSGDSETGLPNPAGEAAPPAPQLALDYASDWWDAALVLAERLGLDADKARAAFAPPDLDGAIITAAREFARTAAAGLSSDPSATHRRRWRIKA